jgi:2Fe-2S ferredoxin
MNCEVTFYPDGKSVKVRSGTTLLEAGKRARVSIRSRCGGNASCLMCKVTVEDQSGLTLIEAKESLKLGDLQDSSIRLACQARVVKDSNVMIPEDPLKAAIRAQLERQRMEDEL